jgi:hypothetical protein
MDTLWSQMLTHGIDVEETEMSLDEFEHLFGNEVMDCPVSD